MNKIIGLISTLNENDFNILFKDKNVFVYFQDEEDDLINFEIPIGSDKYKDFIRNLKDSVIDKIYEIEEIEFKTENDWDMISNLKKLQKCLI